MRLIPNSAVAISALLLAVVDIISLSSLYPVCSGSSGSSDSQDSQDSQSSSSSSSSSQAPTPFGRKDMRKRDPNIGDDWEQFKNDQKQEQAPTPFGRKNMRKRDPDIGDDWKQFKNDQKRKYADDKLRYKQDPKGPRITKFAQIVPLLSDFVTKLPPMLTTYIAAAQQNRVAEMTNLENAGKAASTMNQLRLATAMMQTIKAARELAAAKELAATKAAAAAKAAAAKTAASATTANAPTPPAPIVLADGAAKAQQPVAAGDPRVVWVPYWTVPSNTKPSRG